MNWTTEKPTLADNERYFWVRRKDGEPFIAQWAQFTKDSYGRFSNFDTWDDLFGEIIDWYGPLEPPPMEKEQPCQAPAPCNRGVWNGKRFSAIEYDVYSDSSEREIETRIITL